MKSYTPSRSALARRFVPVAAIMLASTLNLTAAEAEKTAPVAADSHLVELPELVVTARRVEEHPLDVPAYTNVITREQIEKSGASNLIELLKSQANLSFTSLSSSPTNTKVSMRGTGNGDNNGRALILIDGIRANRPDMGSFNWLQFAVQDIESIEVIQGPQGGYYGDNAVGGVIKINTRRGPEKSGGQVSAMVGSFNTVKASGTYTQSMGKTWATVSGGHDESDGYRDHSGYTADSGALAFGYDNKKNSVTQFGVSYIETDFEQPDGLNISQFNADPTQVGGGFGIGSSKTYRVSGSNQYGPKDQSQVLTDAAYYRTNEFARDIFGILYHREIEGVSFSPKLAVKGGEFSATLGTDFDYSELSSLVDASVFASPLAGGELTRSAISPYMGGEYKVNEKLALSGVVRHEFNEISSERTQPTPVLNAERAEGGTAYQLAANYRPSKSARCYVKYDHTYRFPATDEISYYQGLLGGTGSGSNVFFNEKLKAEKSDNVEVGSDWSKGFWSLGGAVYHMRTRDEISLHQYPDFSFMNENIALTKRNGVQSHVGYDNCYYGFRARADYTSARVVENADAGGQQSGQLPMVPVWQTSETVFCRPITGVTVELTHRFTGRSNSTFSSDASKMIELPSANFFDSKITYQITASWMIYTGVNNLLDEQSMSAAINTVNGTNTIYPNEGRFIYLGSTYKF